MVPIHARSLACRRGTTACRGAAFSTDGSTIAFFHPEAGPNGDLWLIPAASGAARQLTSDLRQGGWPVWTRDGQWIVFSSMRAGSRTFWQIPSSGGEPHPLTTGAGEDDQPDIAPDGRHVTFTNVRNRWELHLRDLASGGERTVLNRTTEMLYPLFSPDGERILFFGQADYAVAIMTVTAGASPLWSGDGRRIFVPRKRFESAAGTVVHQHRRKRRANGREPRRHPQHRSLLRCLEERPRRLGTAHCRPEPAVDGDREVGVSNA